MRRLELVLLEQAARREVLVDVAEALGPFLRHLLEGVGHASCRRRRSARAAAASVRVAGHAVVHRGEHAREGAHRLHRLAVRPVDARDQRVGERHELAVGLRRRSCARTAACAPRQVVAPACRSRPSRRSGASLAEIVGVVAQQVVERRQRARCRRRCAGGCGSGSTAPGRRAGPAGSCATTKAKRVGGLGVAAGGEVRRAPRRSAARPRPASRGAGRRRRRLSSPSSIGAVRKRRASSTGSAARRAARATATADERGARRRAASRRDAPSRYGLNCHGLLFGLAGSVPSAISVRSRKRVAVAVDAERARRRPTARRCR